LHLEWNPLAWYILKNLKNKILTIFFSQIQLIKKQAMRIHISQSTKTFLKEKNYKIVERGKLEVKGKGK
jgi:hypothetical protein